MPSKYIIRAIAVLVFVLVYFTILINFAPSIASWASAFVAQNHNMFEFNTTLVTYQYETYNQTVTTVSGNQTITSTTQTSTIVPQNKIITIDFAPFIIFLIYLTIYFIVPIVAPLLYLIGWGRGR